MRYRYFCTLRLTAFIPQLLQLDEEFGFLTHSPLLAPAESSSAPRRVVDLCAAPGSWSQVLTRRLPSGSRIVAVDLQPMAPLPGVQQICGDITLETTAAEVAAALAGDEEERQKADLIVCDGAPDVTGLHALDAYLQSQLLQAAMTLVFRLLAPRGVFVAKIFVNPTVDSHSKTGTGPGGADALLLVAQLRTAFDDVVIAKPRSSRISSAEHFVVASGFRGSAQLDAFQQCGDLADWNEQ